MQIYDFNLLRGCLNSLKVFFIFSYMLTFCFKNKNTLYSRSHAARGNVYLGFEGKDIAKSLGESVFE